MSQRAVFVRVDEELYPEVLHSMPDREECISIARELEYEGPCEVSAVWFEIGEGESDTDEFFPEESMLEWYRKDCIEREAAKLGLHVMVVQCDFTNVSESDIEVEESI